VPSMDRVRRLRSLGVDAVSLAIVSDTLAAPQRQALSVP
jgi:hypothetical protein